MKKKIITFILSVSLAISSCVTVFAGTWERSGDSWKYKQDNGIYAKSGWHFIDRDWYYFFGPTIMTSYEVYEETASGAPRYDLPSYFVGKDGKMIKDGFCKVYDGDSLMFADSTGKVLRGFFMVDNVLYYVSTSPGNSATITPTYRGETKDKFMGNDNKEHTLHYIKDGGKVLELDGNPIKSDDRFYKLIKYLPKYDFKGNFLGAIQN